MAVPISNVTRRQVYAPSGAGGAGPYAFTFEILANTDIAVYKDDVLLTLTTHYTVTINANGTGSVTITAAGLALAPASPTQYAIVGNRTISRTTDFTTGGDFFANTLNDELDQQTIFAQQNAEGLQRALAAPQTDPTSINMTLPRAALRANKALGFDANGNPVISDTLGTNRGNWSAGVLYYARDIVKDTTNNNIWQCLAQHTSIGSQPINTNADSAKWSLLVDAASATTSATNAAASASAASTSASNASTSASNASTSASNASTSASNAASSASAASTSAANAAASYDSFDDRYLGPKSSAPSVDNDGNSLLTGALYWDTVINQMRVWSGTAWVNVNASASNTRTAITATAGQTVLTVATYTPGTNTMVLYVNGAKLNASEYTETNATTVTLTTGLALNDEVEVFSYRVNEIGTLGASSVTIADTGNYYTGSNVEAALQEAASFIQAGTGAVTRTKSSKMQEIVSVLDFGADPTGATDSRTAIQAAINSLAGNNGAIFLPAGAYRLNSGITFPEDQYILFYGAGMVKTQLIFYGTGNAITAASNTTNKIKTTFQGFALFKDASATNATNGIYIKNGQYWSNVKDVWVDGFNKSGTQTIGSYSYNYSGILAVSCWGAEWDRVMLRHNGNGATLIECTGTYKNLDCQVNTKNGLFAEESAATILGGVFQGNNTDDQNNNAATGLEAEIYLMRGESQVIGVFCEGEGTNPAYSIVVDGRSTTLRSYGSKIIGCSVNRTQNTANTRGCIYVGLAENTLIESNSITPTYIGSVSAAAIPHITLTSNSKNTQIGKNAYRGRAWFSGVSYSWASPILSASGLPVQYTFDSAGGGLVTRNSKLESSWRVGSLTAPLSETYGTANGANINVYYWLEKRAWLTRVIAHVPQGQSAGTATIRIYNRVNGSGSLVLLKTLTSNAFSGTANVLLSQHPFVDIIERGQLLVTVQLNATFAPTASNEIAVQLVMEEDDSH